MLCCVVSCAESTALPRVSVVVFSDIMLCVVVRVCVRERVYNSVCVEHNVSFVASFTKSTILPRICLMAIFLYLDD